MSHILRNKTEAGWVFWWYFGGILCCLCILLVPSVACRVYNVYDLFATSVTRGTRVCGLKPWKYTFSEWEPCPSRKRDGLPSRFRDSVNTNNKTGPCPYTWTGPLSRNRDGDTWKGAGRERRGTRGSRGRRGRRGRGKTVSRIGRECDSTVTKVE